MQNGTMHPRLLEKLLRRDQSFFLFGPRRLGKTTSVPKCLPEALCLDRLDHQPHLEPLTRRERLRDLIPAGHHGWIVMDEMRATVAQRSPSADRDPRTPIRAIRIERA